MLGEQQLGELPSAEGMLIVGKAWCVVNWLMGNNRREEVWLFELKRSGSFKTLLV